MPELADGLMAFYRKDRTPRIGVWATREYPPGGDRYSTDWVLWFDRPRGVYGLRLV